jgi:septum formation protein
MRDTGLEFTIEISEFDEDYPDGMKPEKVAEYLARKKAETLTPDRRDQIILTADTIVSIGSGILGKPETVKEAIQMLNQLSGRTHKVYSGVCIALNNEYTSFVEATEVTFRYLSTAEINYYVHHYAPMDKAGAYGIQEWIGLIGITQIKGSYFNVVGLPVNRVYNTLKELDLISF